MRIRPEIKFVGRVMLALAMLPMAGCDKRDSSSSSPTPAPKSQPAEAAKPTQPIIPKVEMVDWCPEHGVPESICAQCNKSLATEFKAKGDWDEKHNVPKSQCFQCDPTLKEKFAAAYKDKYGKEPPTGTETDKR